jgi:peptide/nickel transport system permease protein
MATAVDTGAAIAAAPKRRGLGRWLRLNIGVAVGAAILAVMTLIAALAPTLGTVDPTRIDPAGRNRQPGIERTVTIAGERVPYVHRFGTDSLGRDVYSRTLYGARVSLAVGLCVPLFAGAVGLAIGLVAGYLRWLDGPLMRLMDALMAIPAILLAIALVSVWGAGLVTVVLAIIVPQIPPVVRLTRSIVLSVREQAYVEAAIAIGTRTHLVVWRHVLPETIAPLIVQGTYIAATAILIEAILSFLGIGIPPETPSWGNIMAEGRTLFRVQPHNILFPAIFLSLTVLAVNLVGDGLRDLLDPRLARRM